MRDWKDKVALAAVGLGLLTLIIVAALLLANVGSSTESVVTPIATSVPATTSTPTPAPTPVTCPAGSVARTSISGAITCGAAPTPVVEPTCPAGAVLIKESCQLLFDNPLGESWELGWNTATRFCAEESTAPPPPPPAYMTNLVAGFYAGLEDSCGYIPDAYLNSDSPTALCNDGTYSYSQSRSGTCSWHGGVARWY